MSSDVYFFIHYQRIQKEDSDSAFFTLPEDESKQPKCIFCYDGDYDEENNLHNYCKIFKAPKTNAKGKKNEYHFEFRIDDDVYIIKFTAKKNSYIYDVDLSFGRKILDIRTKIPQNKIEYKDKIDYFIEALKKTGKEAQIKELLTDTFEIYKKNKGFCFLIPLFLKIFEKEKEEEKKDLLPDLLTEFRKMNSDPKINDKNLDRKKYLEEYKDDFEIIAEENLDTNYNIKEFYGIILCYLNCYDYNNFKKSFEKLFKRKKEDLYEILLIYNTHFKKKINQDQEFFELFLENTIDNKDFETFKKGLNYIKEIEIFLHVMQKYRNKIFEKYIKNSNDFGVIKIDKNLTLQEEQEEEKKDTNKTTKEKYDDVLELSHISKKVKNKRKDEIPQFFKDIGMINDFCSKKKIILIYFTNDFWKYILNSYKNPTQENILYCFKLREIFKEYYKLVDDLIEDKKSPIKKEAKDYMERDEFAILLDKSIRIYIDKNKDLTNIQKLDYIKLWNPYYKDPKYSTKVKADIFDLFDLNDIDNTFIVLFKKMKFEIIFKDKIDEYISTMKSKIKNIFHFGEIIKLINISFIENKNKILEPLNGKYDDIIKHELKELNDKNKEKILKVIADFAIFNYKYEEKDKKFHFIEKKIGDLSENIKHEVFKEILKLCIDKIKEEGKSPDDGKGKTSSEEDEDNSSDNETKKIEKKAKKKKKEKRKEENEFAKDINFEDLIGRILEGYIKNFKEEKDIDNIIDIIECLKSKCKFEENNKNNEDNNNDEIKERIEEIINNFLEKLMNEHLFSKDEFFSNKHNHKIMLIYKLYEKEIIKESSQDYYEKIKDRMQEIKKELKENINKKKLDEFLANSKDFILQRLSLIKITLSDFEDFDPDKTFKELKDMMDRINKDLETLINIKNNYILYYKEKNQDTISKLIRIIKENQNIKIKEYEGGKAKDNIKEAKNLEKRAKQIEEVKDFLLFNTIYGNSPESDEDIKFDNAYETLKNIGKLLKGKNGINKLYKDDKNLVYKQIVEIIQEKLGDNEIFAGEFIKKFNDFFQIEDSGIKKELTILFKCKKYELDIKSIKFFFQNFENNNNDWDKKLSTKQYKDFNEIKAELERLQKDKIYDYNNIEDYNRLFRCLNDKKEAFEFLFEKIGKNIDNLQDRIQPTITTLKIEDITDTQKCIEKIGELKSMKDNFVRFDCISKNWNNTRIISQFENYASKYSSIIDLDRYYDKSENIYEQVEPIIKNCLSLKISQENEKFTYILVEEKDDKTEEEIKRITKEELISLKNKITISDENENNKENKTTILDEGETETEDEKEKEKKMEKGNDKIKEKRKILLFFKKVISNLETTHQYMNDLRIKGSSLPIVINIKIKNMNEITYELSDTIKTLKDFKSIKDFLIKAKNNYVLQLETIYKTDPNIRFLYGKQFTSFLKHLEFGVNIESFLRYILNINDNNKTINTGKIALNRQVDTFIDHFEKYNKNSLKSISDYIPTLFLSNNKTLDEHYDDMKMWPKEYKGIFLHECDNYSMEKFIIELFWDKIGKLPISQNILITNKETTDEEIQSFLHRAILCIYNTLFVVEINDSLSEYQQTVINTYVDQLLTLKWKKSNKDVEKKNTQNYLDSCIVFIYDKEKKNITPFFKEIIKYGEKKIIIENNRELDIKNFGNILVVTSEICGLGKSGYIRKQIKNIEKKEYLHFPLGGIINKITIFDKLEKLLNNIKEKKYKYKNVAIHLDLTESKEKSIINEFFFSFLITKFYTNNEKIIYIPKDISIYVEIPNCFDDYLSNFGILNIFNKENITIIKRPPFNYPEDKIKIFKRMLDIDTNDKMELWVNQKIDIKRFSYHQINIFINLFISQYSKLDSKCRFSDKKNNKEDVTDRCINAFANSTKYFTDGGFAKLLTGLDKNDKRDYVDKLSEVYEKENDIKKIKFRDPLIFIYKKKDNDNKGIKEKNFFVEFYLPDKNSDKYKKPKDYLEKLKEILNIDNPVENSEKKEGDIKSLLSIIEKDNYVITSDNFKKMILLVYRIQANVPVIIMGDTGCGKTALIKKLNQLLNNGEETVIIENIHPGVDDIKLCEMMDKVDKKIKKDEEVGKKVEEYWLFLDEINTCLSLSLITEIFINRTYYGKKISDKIRLIGACNPYRKRTKEKEKCGLSLSEDNKNELVYLVQPLPQSLLYYVFSFGSLDAEDEKKYIRSIIEKSFTEEEKQLHELTTDAISQCHIYLRKIFDQSVVSLREIARFPKCLKFFEDYFTKKNAYLKRDNNKKTNKLRGIICSIYLCYYIRLTNEELRKNFEVELRPIFMELINKKKIEEKGSMIKDQIFDFDLKKEIEIRDEKITKDFSDFLKIEQNFLINEIKDLGKGIGKNMLLKENLFLLFVSVVTHIPLIIIGKPGSGKSLSAQITKNTMKGKYSKNKFFINYKKIIQTYFQGSESTIPEDVENLFVKAEGKLEFYKINKIELPISMTLFDELGLAEKSKKNPLKVLHSKLEYGGTEEGVSFVGISNYTLDAAKINRALVLSVPDLDEKLDQMQETAKNIVESISPKIKHDKIFLILSQTYYEYKKLLQSIKELIVLKQYIKKKNKKKKEKINENKNEKPKEKNGGGLDENKKENLNEKNLKENLKGKPTENKNENQNGDGQPTEKHLVDRQEIDTFISESSREKSNIDQNNQEQIKTTTDKINFGFIQNEAEYKDLLKKEKKIRKDFHGNRDFYYLIRGIANDFGKLGEYSDSDKVSKIIKHIERNFGGIEYEIDIDFNLRPDGSEEIVDNIKNILGEYDKFKENEPMEVNSVFLFKKLYNMQCDDLDPNGNLKIDELKINDYNLNNCINDNLKDQNSRFALLEIKQSLTTLIVQNIQETFPYKKIITYDGSRFEDDDNKEYRFEKIYQIMKDAEEDKFIIIQNLDQIHPFLFDLYNMNYEIINDKKYARISLDSNNELKILVNDKFKIIILTDKNYINTCGLAFLNRLEKMNLDFGKLLGDKLKKISEKLIEDLNIRDSITPYNDINYSLKDLLINCRTEEIKGLIYYFSKVSKKAGDATDNGDSNEDNIDVEQIKENICEKIYKILPQDIVAILPDDNILKTKYLEKKDIYDFRTYLEKEENKNYKISIIYTFSSIPGGEIDELNNKMSFMISEIKSENQLNYIIDEIKSKNENNHQKKYDFICIHFKQSNIKNIQFICNFIIKYYELDNYKYIILVHINRNFNHKVKRERILSIPDINPKINHIFIDNLIGNKDTTLNYFINNNKDIVKILNEKKGEMKLDDEFKKELTNFIKEEFEEKGKVSEYIEEIQKYMDNEESIKEIIMNKTYNLIEENMENDEDCSNIIGQIYNKEYINKYTIDIVTCLIDFIKERIFNKYLRYTFKLLEDNNILTTLLEIKKKEKNGTKPLEMNLIKKIIKKYLNETTFDNINKGKCKFLYNYNIPGFFKFFEELSEYINKNIISNYFYNEKKIRELKREDINQIEEFQKTEELLLNNVYEKFSNENKFIFDIISEIPEELIFEDYITYYLQKRNNWQGVFKKDDIYHKIIVLLLRLRFNEENNSTQNNNKVNILLLKIIWLESNDDYVLSILKIIDKSIIIFRQDEDKLYETIENLEIGENKIKYITNDKNNPEHTKEVNECYYILLASICYSITSDDVDLEIGQYYSNLKEINEILQNLNEDLNIYLNEMYIIDELIKIMEMFQFNNIEKINEIKEKIVKNAHIIQLYSNKNEIKLRDELIKNFEETYKLINEEDEDFQKNEMFYDNLRYILMKEIQKISNSIYQYKILKQFIEEKEIAKKSIDIFQFLLKNYLKQETFENNLNKISFGEDDLIKFIDSKLISADVALEETILYLFEKNSIIYLNNIFKNKNKVKIEEKDAHLEILNNCIMILDYYENKPDKISSYLKEVAKLFSLAYIKTYCYHFIELLNDNKFEPKDNIKHIINIFNNKSTICKMIRLYIYKIIYNKYSIYFFYDDNNFDKFELNKFKDFNDFVSQIKELSDINKVEHKVKTLKEKYYDKSSAEIKKFKKDNFTKKISTKDYNIDEYGIDNFYITSFNETLSNLSNLTTKKSETNTNFFNKICYYLFKDLVYNAIELFYSPKKYESLKNQYGIKSNNINPILFGYRYCLNILSAKKNKGIYYQMYIKNNNAKYLQEYYFPGNDSKFNLACSEIIYHFKNKPHEGCYVCLCKNWYYFSVFTGFPENKELNEFCPKCKNPIGLYKREKYFRIFKDEEEIAKLKKDKKIKEKMKEINCITLEKFKDQYMNKLFDEKGVFKFDDNNFKNDKKIIRNLSQVSYRLLNYILYINLFFAQILTKEKAIEQYLPEKLSVYIIIECWNKLKNELLKENIVSIEEFMHYIFVDIFKLLNEEKAIDKYENLVKFEDKLEEKIQELIKIFKKEEENNNKNNIIKPNDKEKTSPINLLKEKYSYRCYESKDFPFYKYFNFTEYLNEQYINEQLASKDENQYPMIKKYLDKKNKEEETTTKYTADNLKKFNKALYLINQKYFNNISTENAQKTKLKEVEIYNINKEAFENLFEFYNNLGLEDEEGNKLKLNDDNPLSDFFIKEDNVYGKKYKEIYKEFIKQQKNSKIESLLQMKNINLSKISVTQINEKQIITLNLPENITFIDILFNCSYRKIIDNYSISYKEYSINFELIEEKLTELLLKNKKLLNEDITEFIYNNEKFSNEIKDLIGNLKKTYNNKLQTIDGRAIFQFCEDTKQSNLFNSIIIGFIKFIKFLNDEKRSKNYNEIQIEEQTIINKIKDPLIQVTTKEFVLLFENNDGLTINKTYEILDFYIKCTFEKVINELIDYQVELSDDSRIIKFFKPENPITKKGLADAIRLFTTLILFPEDDRENKIKNNRNNIVNYLKTSELWDKEMYYHKNFNNYINELKSVNVQINQIIYLYKLLNKDNDIEDELLARIRKNYEDEKNQQNEKEEKEEKEEKKKDTKRDEDVEDDDDDGPLKRMEDDDD